MALIENQIQTKLNSAFQPDFLDIENESHKHNVPPGSESHFRVTVVSEEFEGMSLIKRHQKINEVLREEMEGPVHALSIRAKTPQQWEDNAGLIKPTPQCGGSG